jgi:ribosomal-protein-alanine N-acetyltransferase
MIDDASPLFRAMAEDDVALLATWESEERPYPWSHQTFREALLHGCPTKIFVLEETGRVVAFAAVHRAGDEAYLSNIMTSSSARRRGRAAALLQKVMIWARSSGAAQLVLDVDPSNAPAIALYNKIGFEIIERRPRSYPRGEDAIVMRKLL